MIPPGDSSGVSGAGESSSEISTLSSLTPDEIKSLRAAVTENLYLFARIVLGLDFLYAPLHDPLCDFLAQCPKRSVIVLPRGFLKTSVVTKAYPIWRAVRNPNIRMLIVSNSEPNAKKMVSQIKQVFERNRVFQWLFPDLIPDFAHCRWSDLAAEINRDASIGYQEATFEGAGVGSNVVSRHYDLIIEDDTLSPRKDDATGAELMPMKEEVDQVIGWHRLATSLLITPDQGEIVVVGTRWAYHDLIGSIIQECPEYAHFQRAAVEDGKPTYPTRFPQTALEFIEKEQGPYMFQALYMNRPVAAEKQIFKPEWVREFEFAPANLRTFMAVDLAIKQEESADYNAIIVGGMDSVGRLYILNAVRMRATPREIVDAIFRLAREHPGIERVAVEAVAYQAAMIYMLNDRMVEEGVFLPVEAIKRRERTKEQRILRLQPLMANGRLWFRPTQPELKRELLEFPYGRHDDMIDAMSDLVPMLDLPPGQPVALELPLEARDQLELDVILETLDRRGKPYPFDVQNGRPDSTAWLWR